MSQSTAPLNQTVPRLPPRPRRGHKGTFGTVLVVGGCCAGATRMIGAPALAALGALRAGCGLCRVAAPAPIIGHILRLVPSATGIALPCTVHGTVHSAAAVRAVRASLEDVDCLVVGPGLGTGPPARALVAGVLRAAAARGLPVVVDADALNAVAALRLDLRPLARRTAIVLTPHPGEWRRLAAARGARGDPVRASARPTAARALARATGATVVLKGAGTIVCDERTIWRNRTGNAALATGGTGDVLAGIIGGLIAQRPHATVLAARAAVHAHGRAADLWSASTGARGGLLAADLLAHLPRAVGELRAG